MLDVHPGVRIQGLPLDPDRQRPDEKDQRSEREQAPGEDGARPRAQPSRSSRRPTCASDVRASHVRRASSGRGDVPSPPRRLAHIRWRRRPTTVSVRSRAECLHRRACGRRLGRLRRLPAGAVGIWNVIEGILAISESRVFVGDAGVRLQRPQHLGVDHPRPRGAAADRGVHRCGRERVRAVDRDRRRRRQRDRPAPFRAARSRSGR